MLSLNELEKTKLELNQVSPSFCLAKWLQVTLHLQNGGTHSCHHPIPRRVPLAELESNPSALHNSAFKKQQRKKMLEGKRPRECHYCWKVEDLKGNQTSDRHIKSNDPWARPYLEEVKKLPWDADVRPKYLEVSFSNQCNFKCLYCMPQFSSSWTKEIDEHGHYDLSIRYHWLPRLRRQGLMPISEKTNPYVDHFWKWFPSIYAGLHSLRVTGGEPLLAESTFALLKHIHDNPNPSLDFCVNSNLGVPLPVVRRFIAKLAPILKERSCRGFRLYTSLDSWGPQAEYIRSGLRLELFQRNMGALFEEIPNLELTVMCTFNALGVPRFEAFLKQLLEWKSSYGRLGGRVSVDISHLWHPAFLSVGVLPKDWSVRFDRLVEFMESNGGALGFAPHETAKMRRVRDYFHELRLTETKLLAQRLDFVRFIAESDRRRGTDFTTLFPELAELYRQWAHDLIFPRLMG